MITLAAVVFGLLAGLAALFQVALAFGAPWGPLAMGGRFPGRLPPAMRMAAVVQMAILVVLAVVVSVRARLWSSEWYDVSVVAVWVVVAFCAVSSILNLFTPSKPERLLWAPVALLMLVSALLVALS
ncbi:MAG: hypothetical protein MUE68_04080 [Bacteroidetes bacterium]|jgi:hypothetical protein|nr:hypothetical protein [Bacteroidota bacterium]